LFRLTLPDDANIYGNVHGGTTLKLIEEAGIILSTRYCNYLKKDSSSKIITSMSRIESVDFMKPMKIGEVVELTAEIVYTADRSILVEVTVDAEDLFAARKHTTNKARLWYVAMNEDEDILQVPLMTYNSKEEEEEAQAKYCTLLVDPPAKEPIYDDDSIPDCLPKIPEVHSVAYSETCLSLMVGPNDVAFGKICRGGVFLKLMDECAGIVAAKHCRNNVVTACLDATNFYTHIRIGNVLTVRGKVTFTSKKSIEVEVIVSVVSPFEKQYKSIKAVDAFFTYVAIGLDGRAMEIPPLKVRTDNERMRFDAGMKRYMKRKEGRSSERK
ncbi:hypothetical protein HELRODRAFT_85008, partial [Helobdella robusta]|uniref:HotDog ACOT-type domain-containing protein n=1 Tax=Helobdella robusta TaxID=6412 RepID=T1G5R3_HELRO